MLLGLLRLVFLLGGIAALFAMIASIIHFQILLAMGMLIVTWVCFFIRSCFDE